MSCRLSLHGSNDLEAAVDRRLRGERAAVSASTEAMTLRRDLGGLFIDLCWSSLSLHGSNDLEAEQVY